MYPYDPYNNYEQQPKEDSTPNSYPQSYQHPEQNSYSTVNGYEPWIQEKKPKKQSKLPRYIAAAVAMAVISAGVGGGTAMWVLQNNGPAQVADGESANSGTTLQTTNTAGSSPAEAGSVTAVAQVAADSVVEITTKTEQRTFFTGTSLVQGAGSGVIISEDGYIVTNNHVVSDSDSIVVRTRDGSEYDATLIGTDRQTDLAVIKVEGTGFKAATFADSDNIQVGDMSVAIGNPLGELGGTVTNGIISATGREVTIQGDTMTLLQTSAAINPGNSGGGLFDSNGNLIGIVNAKSQGIEIEGLGFAIPSNTVKEVTADIIDKGYVSGRPQMGIQVVEISDVRTAMMNGVNQLGVYVVDPGDNAGLQSGDRFVFIDGQAIETSNDVSNALRNHEVGDTVKITVVRDGKETQTEVTLTEQQPQVESSEPEPVAEPGDL